MGQKRQRMQPRESQPTGGTIDELREATREAHAAVRDLVRTRRSVETYCREAVQRCVTEALTQIDQLSQERIAALERATFSAYASSQHAAQIAEHVDSETIKVMFASMDSDSLIRLMLAKLRAIITPELKRYVNEELVDTARELSQEAGFKDALVAVEHDNSENAPERVRMPDGKIAIRISSAKQLLDMLNSEVALNGKDQSSDT